MRIWINPDKMAKLGLTATDVSNAIPAQNRQNPAGALGQPPAPQRQRFSVSGERGRPFAGAAAVRRHCVARRAGRLSAAAFAMSARVELGARDLQSFAASNGKPAAILITYLTPGANAVDTADRVTAFMEEAKKDFPAGLEYKIDFDPRLFVRAAIRDVVKTLFDGDRRW